MKMKKLFHTVLFFFITNFVFSQSLVIGSTIFDEKKATISYVNIYVKEERKGTVTNQFGQFELTINQEDFNKELIISAIGFESQSFIISALPTKIYLKKTAYDLEEVVVFSGKEKIIEIGNLEFPETGLIPNFQSIGIRVPEEKEGKPDSLLVRKDIIVQANQKGEWCQIDVSKYNIPLPVDGAYIAMEWLHNEKKYQYKRKGKYQGKKFKLKSYGQGLGIYSKEPNYEFWSYYLGVGWKKELPSYKRLIKAEVAIYE